MSIEAKDIRFSYTSSKCVLNGVSFKANEGELIALLGPNGVGKSTLFKCILGLVEGYAGDTLVDGKSVKNISAKELAGYIAYIPQQTYPAFNYSVFDMVLMGTSSTVNDISSPKKAQEEIALNAMKEVGIEHLKDQGFLHISGGERQLALMARAMSQKARIFIMDEPTSSLDYGNQLRVMAIIKKLTKSGYTVIMSIHNPDQAFMYSDRVLAMCDGKIIADGKPKDVIDSKLIETLYNINAEIKSVQNDKYRMCVPDIENLIERDGEK